MPNRWALFLFGIAFGIPAIALAGIAFLREREQQPPDPAPARPPVAQVDVVPSPNPAVIRSKPVAPRSSPAPTQAAPTRGTDEDAARYRLIDRARSSSRSDLQAQAYEAANALCERYTLACFEKASMLSKGRGVARNEQAALELMERVQQVRAALPERFGRCPVSDKIACLPWTLNAKLIADLKVHAAPKALLAQCKSRRVESCLEILRSLGDVSQDIKIQAAAEVQDACRRGHAPSCEFMAPPTNEEPNLEADMDFVIKRMKEMCERGDESACLITKGSQD